MARIIKGKFKQPSDREAEIIAMEQRTLERLKEWVERLKERAEREGRVVPMDGRK